MLRRKPRVPYRTLRLSRFRRRGRTEEQAFETAVREANDTDHILLFTKRWYMADVSMAKAHPYGVVVRQGHHHHYALNGKVSKDGFSDGVPDGMRNAPEEGVIKKREDAFYLNGRLLYKGPHDDWQSHRYGLLIVIGNEYRVVIAKPFDPDRVNC